MRTRDKQVNIRMTEKEYQQIKKKAERVKLSMSAYIIKAARDKEIIDEKMISEKEFIKIKAELERKYKIKKGLCG